ncbi:glycosyl transferase GT4 family protein [Methanobrevibacter thaueri]|uniref:glycosyl transferase GT4 family protein n=1 Tax=Methanobrevibacter thaueri TaxID=190975 RepID=UPI0026EFC7AC|nr:glycosyl transferase GT4 family protein [Methanobrevibacter thaueri]
MKKVIYIAFNYNHDTGIASKRLRGVSKYLPSFGWQPIVIVPRTSNDTVKMDNVRVIETDYQDMISRFMPKSNNTGRKREVSGRDQTNKFVSKSLSLAGEIFAYPDSMKYWKEPAVEAASEIIENEKIDAILSTSSPITSHIIAHDLKEKYNIPWVADLRDLWNLNPYINHTFIRRHFEKRLEMKTFKNVDALTTTTELAKETLQGIHPDKKITTVVSGFDPEDFEKTKQTKNSEKLTLMYAGSLYSGKRDPSILFDAIGQLISENKIDSDKIIVDFYGDETNLRELSQKYDITDNVNIHGRITQSEVLKHQMNSDVLLLISWMNESEKMFIPGKVYDCIGCRKPILSIGYKEGSLKDLIDKTNIGYHVSNVEDCKKAIYDYYTKYNKNELKYTGNEFAQDYSLRNTAKNFSKILEEVI